MHLCVFLFALSVLVAVFPKWSRRGQIVIAVLSWGRVKPCAHRRQLFRTPHCTLFVFYYPTCSCPLQSCFSSPILFLSWACSFFSSGWLPSRLSFFCPRARFDAVSECALLGRGSASLCSSSSRLSRGGVCNELKDNKNKYSDILLCTHSVGCTQNTLQASFCI